MIRLHLLCLWLLMTLLICANVHADNEVPAVVYLDQITTSEAWREAHLKIHHSSGLRIADRSGLQLLVPFEQADRSSWPKAWTPLVMDQDVDWTQFDRLEFWIMARLRPPLVTPPKKIAVQFLCPDKDNAVSSTVFFPESDAWVRVEIPTRDQEVFKRLNALQFYMAKRWYAGVDSADFHVAGFRLVRDPGPLADEFHLLTPFPGHDQPVLRIETATAAAMQMHIEQDGRLLHEVTTTRLDSGQHAVDLSPLNLSQGRYQLVANRQNQATRRIMPFDWQPFEIKQISLGEGFTGNNISTVHLLNASSALGEVQIDVRFNGRVVAQKKAMIPADSLSQVTVDWPLKPGDKGNASIKVHAGSNYVGGSSQTIQTPDVYASLSPHRPVTFQMSHPVTFRIPVWLASGSRAEAKLHWVLSDQAGQLIDTGQSMFVGNSAPVQINSTEKIRSGLYTLNSTIQLNQNAYKKQWNLYLVEDATADLLLSLQP